MNDSKALEGLVAAYEELVEWVEKMQKQLDECRSQRNVLFHSLDKRVVELQFKYNALVDDYRELVKRNNGDSNTNGG